MKHRITPIQDYYVIVDCLYVKSVLGKEEVYMRVLEFARNKDTIINKLESVLYVMGKLQSMRWATSSGLPYVTIANPKASQHYIGIIGRDQFREAVRNKYKIKLGVSSSWELN